MDIIKSFEEIAAGADLVYIPDLIKVKLCVDECNFNKARDMLEIMGANGDTCWHDKCLDLAESL